MNVLFAIISSGFPEPLLDPLTLLRFYNSRDRDPVAAVGMWRETTEWRERFGVGTRVMSRFGQGATYVSYGGGLKTAATAPAVAAGQAMGTAGPWGWKRAPPVAPPPGSPEDFGDVSCFYGRLAKDSPVDSAPVAVWRLGSVDWSGVAREGAQQEVTDAFVSHLEDVLQAGRAASIERKQLVRARLIIDGTGLGLGTLANIKLIKSITSMGKAFFPETTASATIVNAPWIFAKVYGVISPLLTEVMRRKVCILDTDFEAGFEAHCEGIKRADLPNFLGGEVSDAQCPFPTPVPRGMSTRLKAMREARAHEMEEDAAAAEEMK